MARMTTSQAKNPSVPDAPAPMPSGDSSAISSEVSDLDPAREVARELHRACEAIALYAHDHPVALKAIARCGEALAQAMRGKDGLRVAFSHGRNADIGATSELGGEFEAICQRAHQIEIAGIEFKKPVMLDSISLVARALVEAHKDHLSGEALAQSVAKVAGPGVRLVPLDYRGLRVVDALGAHGQAAVSLSGLIEILMSDRGHTLSSHDLGVLANEIHLKSENDGAGARTGSGGGTLTGASHADAPSANGHRSVPDLIVEALANAPIDDRAQLVDRFRSFARSLSPALRERVLGLEAFGTQTDRGEAGGEAQGSDRARADAMLIVLSQLADVLSPKEIIDALERADRAGARPSRELMRIFSKLTQLCKPDQQSSASLERVRTAWSSAGADATTMHQAIEELLRSPESGVFTPDDYQERLSELAANAAPSVRDLQSRVREASVVLSERTTRIALWLAQHDGEDPDDSAGPFDLLRDRVPELIERSHVGLLAEVAHVAIAAEHSGRSRQTLERAAALRTRVRESDAATRLNDYLTRPDIDARSASELILLGGSQALLAAIVSLADRPRESMRESVLLALKDPGIDPSELVAPLSGQRELVVLTMLQLVQELEPGVRHQLVGSFLSDPRGLVRRASYQLVNSEGQPWHSVQLKTALEDEDLGVMRVALAHIKSVPTRESLGLLLAVLIGEVRKGLSEASFDECADILAGLGEPGLACLCEALRHLSGKPGVRVANRAARLLRLLDTHSDIPCVRETLTPLRRLTVRAFASFFRSADAPAHQKRTKPPGATGS